MWAFRYRRDIGLVIREAVEWEKRYKSLLARTCGVNVEVEA